MINNVILVGLIENDVKITSFADGNQVASFTLKTWEQYNTREGEAKLFNDFHRCSIDLKICKNAQYFKKGDLLTMTGKLKTRKYQDKNGKDAYITEVKGYAVLTPLATHTPTEPVQAPDNRYEQVDNQFPQTDDLPF